MYLSYSMMMWYVPYVMNQYFLSTTMDLCKNWMNSNDFLAIIQWLGFMVVQIRFRRVDYYIINSWMNDIMLNDYSIVEAKNNLGTSYG